MSHQDIPQLFTSEGCLYHFHYTIMDSTNASENRFALITYDNHSGYLWISSILCLVYTTLILIVRLHLKWKLYGADDLAATIATVSSKLCVMTTMLICG